MSLEMPEKLNHPVSHDGPVGFGLGQAPVDDWVWHTPEANAVDRQTPRSGPARLTGGVATGVKS